VRTPPGNGSTRTYFAAEPFSRLPEATIGEKLITKVEEYDSHQLVRMVDEKLALAYQHYFGYSPDGFHATSIVARAGDQGELAAIRVNHARALVNALLNLIVKDKFVWQPRAANYSYEAIRQTELAANVLEHYWHNFRVKEFTDRAVEEAIAFTEGFVLLEWDEEAGVSTRLPDPSTPNGILRTGDLKYSNVSSWNVIRDPFAQSWDELKWVIVKTMRNRYDVAARVHKLPEDKLTPQEKEELCERVYRADQGNNSTLQRTAKARDWENDTIPVFIFYHKPDAILPFGRETHFLSDGTVIKDIGLELDIIPLFRVVPADLIGTPYGYSQFLEILGIQEMADAVYSSLATNISTFSTQSLLVDEGVNFHVEDAAGGLKVIYKPTGIDKAIEPLQLTRSPPEAFSFVKDLKMHQELLMGLNETVRGQVEADRMSGAHAALLDAQALRQASTLAGNYVRLVQQLGTYSIKMFRKKANYPLKISIVGKNKLSLIKETEVSGKDLTHVDQIFVDVGNPATQNPMMRYEMAKEMLQMGAINSPEQVQEVMETGRLEPVTIGVREELRNILRENELITQGEAPRVMLHDNHLLHGKEHTVPVNSPEAREKEVVVTAYMKHMHDHYLQFYGNPPGEYISETDLKTGQPILSETGSPVEIFQQTDPLYRERMLILSGQVPPPPMMPPGMMPPPGAEPGPEGGGESGPVPASPMPPGESASPKPAEPPDNPATGQQWNPSNAGGGV
jgi:hypothetical protein